MGGGTNYIYYVVVGNSDILENGRTELNETVFGRMVRHGKMFTV